MPMGLLTNTYKLSATSTSAAVTLSDADSNTDHVVIYNEGTDDAFVTSATSSATAVMPGSSASAGKRVAAGATVTYRKNPSHKSIAAICDSTQTATLWISPGTSD